MYMVPLFCSKTNFWMWMAGCYKAHRGTFGFPMSVLKIIIIAIIIFFSFLSPAANLTVRRFSSHLHRGHVSTTRHLTCEHQHSSQISAPSFPETEKKRAHQKHGKK